MPGSFRLSRRMRHSLTLLATAALASIASADTGAPDIERHRAAAMAAARGSAFMELLATANCARHDDNEASVRKANETLLNLDLSRPDRKWEAADFVVEPAALFDNVTYIGTKLVSAFVIKTSQGLILIDTLNSADEVETNLRKAGFDPAQVKYALISQAAPDHFGGARHLQDTYGTRIVMAAADWEVLPKVTDVDFKPLPADTLPRRDVLAGKALTLGKTTISIIPTPGHTPGTNSFLIPVADKGRHHLALLISGLYFSREPHGTPAYIRQIEQTYASRQALRRVVLQRKPDVLFANHPLNWDGIRMMATRRAHPEERNPLIVGQHFIERFMTVYDECARADLIRMTAAR